MPSKRNLRTLMTTCAITPGKLRVRHWPWACWRGFSSAARRIETVVIFQALSGIARDYLDSTVQGALGSLEIVIRQFLLGAAVFLLGIALVLIGLIMILAGGFLYLCGEPQFLVPALLTASLSVLAGLPLLKAGSSMSRLTRQRQKFNARHLEVRI